jgi:hypothetical protein
MRKDIFAIPIFEDVVDLEKIKIECESYSPTWDSKINTSFCSNQNVSEETWIHLNEVISRNLNQINCSYNNARIERIWRNVYTEENYQDPHIHPHCQWSFIIYETVDESKTIFFNPAFKEIQNQINHSGIPEFPIDYRPKLKSGSIIIFPSFLMHMVIHGNTGTTIAGNIKLEYIL